MTSSIQITGSVSCAIYPSGSLVPVRQAVGSASEAETFYPTANRPAAPIVVCRIQFQSASQDGKLARIERPNSCAFLASLLAGATPAGSRFIRALNHARKQAARVIIIGFGPALSCVVAHVEQHARRLKVWRTQIKGISNQ